MYNEIGNLGCCLVCDENGSCNSPCFSCLCTSCSRYEPLSHKGLRCGYLIFKNSDVWISETSYLSLGISNKTGFKAVLIEFLGGCAIGGYGYEIINECKVWIPKKILGYSNAQHLFDRGILDSYELDWPNKKFIGIPAWFANQSGVITSWSGFGKMKFEEFEEDLGLFTKKYSRDEDG